MGPGGGRGMWILLGLDELVFPTGGTLVLPVVWEKHPFLESGNGARRA